MLMLLLAPCPHLDVGRVDLSQEDLLRLQAAQFAQLFLQPHVLFVHVQPQAVTYGSGTLQFNHCKSTKTPQGSAFVLEAGLRRRNLPIGLLTGDLQMHVAIHGQGQRQEVEGVETGADVPARLAFHLGLELTVEQIHDDGAVPTQVVLPGLQDKSGRHNQGGDTTIFLNLLTTFIHALKLNTTLRYFCCSFVISLDFIGASCKSERSQGDEAFSFFLLVSDQRAKHERRDGR